MPFCVSTPLRVIGSIKHSPNVNAITPPPLGIPLSSQAGMVRERNNHIQQLTDADATAIPQMTTPLDKNDMQDIPPISHIIRLMISRTMWVGKNNPVV